MRKRAEKVDVSVHFLTEMNIAELTIELDSFADWVKPVIAAVESQFKDESASRTVIVQVTLHRNRPADVTVAEESRLLSPRPRIAALQKSADPAKAPRTKVIRLHVSSSGPQINGGHPRQERGSYVPAIETPDDHRLAEFPTASAAGKGGDPEAVSTPKPCRSSPPPQAHAEAKYEGVRPARSIDR